MTTTPSVLIQNVQLPNATAVQYTSTNLTTLIDKCTVCNTTGTAATLTIDLGGSGAAYRVISARSIAAGETYTCPEVTGQILLSSNTFNAFSGTANALTIRVSGRLVT